MFYSLLNNEQPFEIDPFLALVGPRPIGWISTISSNGVPNLAPYSFFNTVSSVPPIVMFSSEGRKDTINNIERTGEFICNLATWNLRHKMNISSSKVQDEVDEFELAQLDKNSGRTVQVPRVTASPAALECKYLETIRFNNLDGELNTNFIVLGQVTGIHIDNKYIEKGRVKTAEMKLLARHGYSDFSVTEKIYKIARPGNTK